MVDVSAYPPGPNGMADLCRDKEAELLAEIAGTSDARLLKAKRKHLRTVQQLGRWARSRAGYVKPGKTKP